MVNKSKERFFLLGFSLYLYIMCLILFLLFIIYNTVFDCSTEVQII